MGLIEQLKSERAWQKRRELVRACQDTDVLSAWISQEPEGWVRAAMATAFGQLCGPEALRALDRLRNDESGMVRIAAVKALDRLQTPVDDKSDDDDLVRQTVVETQSPTVDRAHLDSLTETLARETDPQARALAIYQTMLETGREILPTVRALWQTETAPAVRVQLAEVMIRLGTDSDRDRLCLALREESEFAVRAALITQLARVGGASVRDAFIHQLSIEPTVDLQIALIRSLARWPSLDGLRAIFHSQTPFVSASTYAVARKAWDDILPKLTSPELSTLLAETLSPTPRLVAVQTLRNRRQEPREVYLRLLRTERDRAVLGELIAALLSWEEFDVPTILLALRDEHRAYELAHPDPDNEPSEPGDFYTPPISDLFTDALRTYSRRSE